MSRNLIISLLVSILLHGGTVFSGYLFKKKPQEKVVSTEIPTIALDMPPPPPPDEPEPSEEVAPTDAPTEVADLAPPMQNDVISAVIDSPFVQQVQAPVPTGLSRPTGNIVIPTNTKPSMGTGKAMGNVFDLASLDQRPEARLRIKPVYPFELRRSGIKGEVTVGFIVDRNGDVREPYIVKSTSQGFEQAAIDAVLKWKFKPGKKGGAAVNTRVAQPLTFSLNAE